MSKQTDYRITHIDRGIHTFEVSFPRLKYSQVQRVNGELVALGKIVNHSADEENVTRQYESRYFLDEGISAIRTYQSPESSNCICMAINPLTLISGEIQPVALFSPSEKSCQKIQDKLADVTEEIGLENLNDSIIRFDSTLYNDCFSVSQIDVTMNCWFGAGTDLKPIIRLFKKSHLPRHFKRFDNNHDYFCCGNGSVVIKAYDKTRELSERNHMPEKMEDAVLLRIEVSMKRQKFLSTLDLHKEDSLFIMLYQAYRQSAEIMNDYLRKLFPSNAPHYTYDETMKVIERKVKKEKTRERMIAMVEKTSHKAGLDKAASSMKENGLQKNQIDQLYNEFNRIGVNPITIPNKSEDKMVPNIRSLLSDYGFNS